ncbi:histidine kinase [Streptomyces sp. DSM 44917]|uniref:histidine kinase n=1 Tax=Streptomyces boetiae TaxID=3075541 RepID=A0ABU2L9A4_9ACTN|nr:histidine kinase [Streptomyces sp. DSM 44917]MDT0308082.1 histidine kinase [Streptomyces sp. DSM 44917]
MGRVPPYAGAAAVLAADLALTAAATGWPWPALAAWGAGAAGVLASGRRAPVPAFVAVLLLAAPTGGGFALLLWSGYAAGRALERPRDAALVVGGAAGALAAQLTTRAGATGADAASHIVSTQLVFVVLPLLVGRYLAEHRRLVTALAERNRRLLLERELLAERERLRERLRIARDVHDSLGHRLALVSVQAAALEVSAALPPAERETTRHLAGAARAALGELHGLVGALRGAEAADDPCPDAAAIERVAAEFRAAGLPVALRQRGTPVPLSAAAWRAAFRVAEEGLTNAAKHAPGRPVTVGLGWEQDALLLTVESALPAPAEASAAGSGGEGEPAPRGHGLDGLAERVGAAGGLLDHRRTRDAFRLFALLPAAPAAAPAPQGGPPSGPGRARTFVLGLATAVLVFGVLPAGLLLGLR